MVRPVIHGELQAADGSWIQIPFLVDTGADRTVLSASVVQALGAQPLLPSSSLQGVGGSAATVTLDTRVYLERDGGARIAFRGQFAAFTDPAALDMSVLGRDITNLFAVIIDRPQDVVCLIGQTHRYVITQD